MSLGDLFPINFKEEFAERNVNLGKAILVKIESINVTYPKFIIILGIDNTSSEIGYIFINTEINPNLFPTSYLKSQHILIDVDNHDFLEYDSYIDCSQIKTENKDYILSYVKNNPDCVKKNVSDEILKKIVITITNSKLISKNDKTRFGFL